MIFARTCQVESYIRKKLVSEHYDKGSLAATEEESEFHEFKERGKKRALTTAAAAPHQATKLRVYTVTSDRRLSFSSGMPTNLNANQRVLESQFSDVILQREFVNTGGQLAKNNVLRELQKSGVITRVKQVVGAVVSYAKITDAAADDNDDDDDDDDELEEEKEEGDEKKKKKKKKMKKYVVKANNKTCDIYRLNDVFTLQHVYNVISSKLPFNETNGYMQTTIDKFILPIKRQRQI